MDTNAPLIGKFCGNYVEEFIVSTTNALTIEYYTDDLTLGLFVVAYTNF